MVWAALAQGVSYPATNQILIPTGIARWGSAFDLAIIVAPRLRSLRCGSSPGAGGSLAASAEASRLLPVLTTPRAKRSKTGAVVKPLNLAVYCAALLG